MASGSKLPDSKSAVLPRTAIADEHLSIPTSWHITQNYFLSQAASDPLNVFFTHTVKLSTCSEISPVTNFNVFIDGGQMCTGWAVWRLIVGKIGLTNASAELCTRLETSIITC